LQALRYGIPGIAYTPARATELVGKECGNGVVIAHDQSWETQYCHLKERSISVNVGDTVQVGDVLGKIGLSGRTQFPHVHISVLHNETRIDPFAPSGRITCNSSADTLWDTAIEYDAGGLLSLRFLTICKNRNAALWSRNCTTYKPKSRNRHRHLLIWGAKIRYRNSTQRHDGSQSGPIHAIS
jgi:hypothetical protein